MTYAQTLDYLYNALPMFSRLGTAAYKADLTNIIALCDYLNHPEKRFKTIHIAGTNGKGSVSHMLAATLQTAGYKTGLYTSPHLIDFRERIKIDGAMVSEAFVVQFVDDLKPVIEKIEPSFFEITVAMAFQFFAEHRVDVAVIEVGLGGRLDSTNIIHPELAVITNISYDHMNLLGNTLPLIAAEKAGIIKENVPVVIGERQSETDAVFKQTAVEKGAPIYFAPDRFLVHHFSIGLQTLQVEIEDRQHGVLKKLELDLPGIYQTKNCCTVLQAVALLQQNGFKITDTLVQEALHHTKEFTGLHGRWEVVREAPAVILEVAHNVAGISQMLAHLQHITYEKLHIVLGMVKEKEIENVLKLLPTTANYYFTQAHIPRALDAEALQQKAAGFDLIGKVYHDANTALQDALRNSSAKDLIIVCGSIFLVAEVDKQALISDHA